MASALPSNEKATASGTPHAPESKHDVEAGGTPTWDRDVAMAIVGEHAHAIDPLFMIPAMIIGYGFVYYDKVSPILLRNVPNC
jgi:hypothetical protein